MPPMAREDGGFLWLIGSILGAVDDSFDYNSTVTGMQAVEDNGTSRTTISSRNQKGEATHVGIIETPYNDWRNDNRNVREINELNDQYDNGARGGWLW